MTAATRKKQEARNKETQNWERAHFSSFFFLSSFPVFSSLLFLFSGRKDYVKTTEKKEIRERKVRGPGLKRAYARRENGRAIILFRSLALTSHLNFSLSSSAVVRFRCSSSASVVRRSRKANV